MAQETRTDWRVVKFPLSTKTIYGGSWHHWDGEKGKAIVDADGNGVVGWMDGEKGQPDDRTLEAMVTVLNRRYA